MEGVTFPQHNANLTAPEGHEDEVYTLPVHRTGTRIVSCWRPTWREVVSILFHRRVWLMIWAQKTQPPVLILGQATVFEDPLDANYTKKRRWLWALGCVALAAMIAVGIGAVRGCSAAAATPGSPGHVEASVAPTASGGAPVSPQDATGASPGTTTAPDDDAPETATESPGDATGAADAPGTSAEPVYTTHWRWTPASGPVAYYRACMARPGTPLPPVVMPDAEEPTPTPSVSRSDTLNGAIFDLVVQACTTTHECGPWSEPGKVIALPEPGILLMLAAGLIGLGILNVIRRRNEREDS